MHNITIKPIHNIILCSFTLIYLTACSVERGLAFLYSQGCSPGIGYSSPQGTKPHVINICCYEDAHLKCRSGTAFIAPHEGTLQRCASADASATRGIIDRFMEQIIKLHKIYKTKII